MQSVAQVVAGGRRASKTRLAFTLRSGQAYANGRARIEKGNSGYDLADHLNLARLAANRSDAGLNVNRANCRNMVAALSGEALCPSYFIPSL